MNATVKPGKLIKGQTGDWEVVIGLEVHAQVTSKSKLFSGASTEFGGEPNSHVSLVDAAMPGMLPVINEECVRQAVTTGLGLNAQDQPALGVRPQELFLSGLAAGLPDQPVQVADRGRGRGRWSNWTAARPRRSGSSGCIWSRTPASCCTTSRRSMSYVDLNRCGVALMEIVSKPDIRDAEQAKAYVTKLRSILRYLGTCDGDMEKGSLARRRQRLRAQAGRAARHPLRNQEHELDQFHRPGDRVRGAAPDRDHRGWRRDRPGNAAVRPEQGRDALDALQGRGARLSLFPGSRPAAAGIHASLCRRTEGRSCRNCRTRRRRASSRASDCRLTTPACWWPSARARISTKPCSRALPTRRATASSRPTG